ncbi:hypothetical protein Q7P37_007066 [Cladosporium fusiforme]
MSEHKEDSISPVGPDTNGLDGSTVEPDQVNVGEYIEVDLNAPGDIANETEQHNLPRLVLPEGQSDGNDSQPASAFSSSSEEGDDADDEAGEGDGEEGEGDDDDDDDDTEEWNKSPLPSNNLPKHIPVSEREFPPAVWGERDSDNEFTLYQCKNYLPVSYHKHSRSSSADVKEKQAKYREVPPNHPAQPSPLRSASSPDSPVSPISPTSQVLSASQVSPVSAEDEEAAQEIGILPEPSPELPKALSLDDHEETPQQTLTHARNSSAASFNWSEEDEDDASWVAGAIQNVTGNCKPSEDCATAQLVKIYQDGDVEGSCEGPEAPGNAPDTEDEDFMIADEHDSTSAGEQSTTEGGGATSQGDALFAPLKSGITIERPPSGSQLTLRTTGSGAEAESQDRSTDTLEQSGDDHPSTETPRDFDRTFEGSRNNDAELLVELTSPDFKGPEPLTGLGPQEGLDAWWEWRTRNQRGKFRSNHNLENEDDTGDLKDYGEPNPDTSDAADHLNKQRFMLKELAARQGRDIAAERASNIRQNMEDTMEYLKLKMLYYRAQRNHFFYETRGNRERVGRRDETIRNLEARTGRRDDEIKELEAKVKQVYQAYKHEKQRYVELEPMLKEFQTELQREKDLREKERNARKELQLKLGNLTQVADQLRKSAEANAEEVRIERAKRKEAEMFSDDDDDTTQSNGLQVVKHRGNSRSASPSPGPEQFIRWPLTERTQLIPFMVEWINEHREFGSLEEPLSPGQLDTVLGVGAISWDQLIDELRKIGYTFRPDHLAAALSDPQAIGEGLIPRPNLAVMYAARRLSPATAVSDLLREVANLSEELEGIRMPQQVLTHIDELESENRRLQSEHERHTADFDSIRTTVNQFVKKTSVPAERNHETDMQERLNQCHQHGQQLQAELEKLTEQLRESEEVCATFEAASAELEERIEELEEKARIPTDDDETDRSENAQLQDEIDVLRSLLREQEEIEDELTASQAHNEELQGLVDELQAARPLSSPSNKDGDVVSPITADNYESRIEYLRSDLIAANEANDALIRDLEKLQANFDASQEHGTSLSDRNAILETENATLHEQVKTMRAEIDGFQEAINKLSTQADADVLQQKNEETIARNTQLEEEVQAAYADIEGLQEQINEINAELDAHRCSAAASLRSRSVSSHTPFPGLVSKGQVDQATQTDPALLSNRGVQTWAQRERVITQDKSFIAKQEKKQTTREKQHAAERERLALLRRMIEQQFGGDELPYVPVGQRIVAAMA